MNLLERLREDHRHFFRLAEELDRAVVQSPNRYYTKGWTDEAGHRVVGKLHELVRALDEHEEVEMDLLFPALRRHAPDAERLLGQMAIEHGSIESAIAELERDLPDAGKRPAGWLVLHILRFTNLLQHHMRREETEIFPQVARLVPAEELSRLGRDAAESRPR